jgi:hypothetical protein
LQTVFALSTAEAEYIALSTALRDVIPMMDLLKEMKEMGYDVHVQPVVHCKLFSKTIRAHSNRRVWQNIVRAHDTLMPHGITSAPMLLTN